MGADAQAVDSYIVEKGLDGVLDAGVKNALRSAGYRVACRVCRDVAKALGGDAVVENPNAYALGVLRNAAADAALPLDDFAALVANNSQNLAALFGSTTQGAKGIALLGEQVRDVGIERLAPLGFTVDEVNETLLLNLERQRRTNISSRLTDQQRISSAIRFAEELDRLARLTGQHQQEWLIKSEI